MDLQALVVVRFQESFGHTVLQKTLKDVVIGSHVKQGARRLMKALLGPNENLKNFFQGAHVAGKNEKPPPGDFAFVHGA